MSLRLRFLMVLFQAAPLGTQARELQEDHSRNKETPKGRLIVMILASEPSPLAAEF
jgi:hypothetical protein